MHEGRLEGYEVHILHRWSHLLGCCVRGRVDDDALRGGAHAGRRNERNIHR